jgi:hypothetical protein
LNSKFREATGHFKIQNAKLKIKKGGRVASSPGRKPEAVERD